MPPIKILRADEPITVKRIVKTIYGPPGVGKSTLGNTAAKPLVLDFDNGAHRAALRQDIVPVSSWQDVVSINADDLAEYETVVIDTVGRALDFLSADIISSDPKMGRAGSLTLQGFGQLKTRFSAFLRHLIMMDVDVVLIAHSEEQHKGDDIITRLDAHGASKNEVHKCSDVMGLVAIDGGRRVLRMSPTATSYGKDPAGLGDVAIPSCEGGSSALAIVIQTVKDHLNQQSAAVLEAKKEQDTLVVTWQEMDAELLTSEAKRLSEENAPKRLKAALMQVAKEAGMTWDREAGEFVPPAEDEHKEGEQEQLDLTAMRLDEPRGDQAALAVKAEDDDPEWGQD